MSTDGQLRAQTLAVLATLTDSVKAQSAFLNSCCEADWLDEESRLSVRWLLSALKEHRRSLCRTTRIWRTLPADEAADGALVAATTELLDEHRFFEPHLERWRAVAVGRLRSDRARFWREVAELAESNLRRVADPVAASGPLHRRTA